MPLAAITPPADLRVRPSGDTTPGSGGPGRDGLHEVAQQFEAVFLRQLLAAAAKTDFGGEDLFGSAGEDTFREMRDARFAEMASQTGTFGIAAALETQLASQIGSGD